MNINTVGELKKALKSVPDNAALYHLVCGVVIKCDNVIVEIGKFNESCAMQRHAAIKKYKTVKDNAVLFEFLR